MKFYVPEKEPVLHDGVRQYLQEDLDYITALAREIARQDVIIQVTEENSRRRHRQRLTDMYVTARQAFLKKWSKP